MLRRDLLRALAAFVTAAPAATPSGVRREPPFSGAGKPAVSAKSPPVTFTPPTAPAEPEPAVFGVDLAEGRDYSPLPAIDASKITPRMQALREALWEGDQLPVEVDFRGNSTRIVFFCPESARRLGTDERKQALARHAIATMIPAYARIYNGGVACEVTFRRIEA